MFSVQELAKWYSNKTAWMNSDIFTDYMKSWDRELQAADRKIVLLLDNAGCHALDEGLELHNIKLAFFGPT